MDTFYSFCLLAAFAIGGGCVGFFAHALLSAAKDPEENTNDHE